MATLDDKFPGVYDCLTIVFLSFNGKINGKGPKHRRARHMWQQVMKQLSRWDSPRPYRVCWATVAGDSSTIVVLANHRNPVRRSICYPLTKLEEAIATIADALSPLQPFLATTPCLMSTIWHDSSSYHIASGLYSVMELMTVDVDRVENRMKAPQGPAEPVLPCTLRYPMSTLPFLKQCQRVGYDNRPKSRWERMLKEPEYAPGKCGSNFLKVSGPLRGLYTGHRLPASSSWLQEENDGNEPDTFEEVMAIHWESIQAREWVLGTQRWRDHFEHSIHLLQKEGRVTDVQRWTLKIHTWPPPSLLSRTPLPTIICVLTGGRVRLE